MEDQRSNGASDGSAVDATVTEDPSATSTQLVQRERRSEVLHPLDREQLVASFREYQELCRELLDDSDYQSYTQRERDPGGDWRTVEKRFKKKSAWRKLATAFDLDVQIVHCEVERDAHGHALRASVIARAIAPSGRYQDGDGYCSATEPRFTKDKGREKLENDLRGTATTRAKNRAISDLLGTGEVSAEEVGGDGAAAEAQAGPPCGRVVSTEAKPAATEAAVRLSGGDVEQAKALWGRIQAACGGYMPGAAATALVHAAGQLVDEQQARSSPAPGVPPAANPHGVSLRATAKAREIEGGELANLIRVAAGSTRIPDERAAGQLETLLERITEPVARQTLELIEMLHPTGEPHDDADPEAGSADFAAFDPDAARAA